MLCPQQLLFAFVLQQSETHGWVGDDAVLHENESSHTDAFKRMCTFITMRTAPKKGVGSAIVRYHLQTGWSHRLYDNTHRSIQVGALNIGMLNVNLLHRYKGKNPRAQSSKTHKASTLTRMAQQHHHDSLSQHTSQYSCSNVETQHRCSMYLTYQF